MSGTNEHDSYFKLVFSKPENVAGELRSVLPPDLVAHLDLDAAKLVPGSFVDESLAARHTDLLFEVPFGAAPAFVYVLFEHRSSSDALLVVRLLVYMARIWERWLAEHEQAKRVPPILPVVVSQGPPAWGAPVSFHDALLGSPEALALVREHVPSFRFVLDDLAAAGNSPLEERTDLPREARLALVLLSELRRVRDDLAGLAALLRRVGALTASVAEVGWIHYVVTVTDLERGALERVLAEVSQPEKEQIMSTAERLRQEGRLEGRQEGRLEGRQEGRLEGWQEGRLEVLLRQVRARFKDSVTPEVEARIRHASGTELDRWVDAVVTASTLEALLAS